MLGRPLSFLLVTLIAGCAATAADRAHARPMQVTAMPLRFSVGLVRASLHAAVVLSVGVSLFLLFLLWWVLELLDSSQ